jgi:hypothetical protein
MIKDNKEYNGWRNWATWNVMLWINNDEPLYRASRGIKTKNQAKIFFQNNYSSFVDFHDMHGEKQNIDWNEVVEAIRES